MFCRLMVAFDGSEPSHRALRAGAALAKELGKPLHTITVIEGLPEYVTASAFEPADAGVVQALSDQREAYTQKLLDDVRQVAASVGIEVTAEAVEGDEIESIVNAVKIHECDLLVVGLRHHPGLIDRLTARTVHTLAERAPCSVLGVR